MRELTFNEVEEVSGGIAPWLLWTLVGAGAGAAGFGVGTFFGWTTTW